MTRARKMLIAGATALVLAAGGVGIAQAVGGDSEEQATGPEADRAKRAAVDAVGGGRAVGVEREDGVAAWEVEVWSGGRQIEVKLSRGLEPVGTDRDDERRDDDGRDDERGDDDGREGERGDDDGRDDEPGDDDGREDEDDESEDGDED